MCRKYARFFANEGYAAFIFDFNGGGLWNRSSGKTTDMSVLTEVEDLKAVIDYECSLSYTDGSRITLMGCSQGGYRVFEEIFRVLIIIVIMEEPA